MNLIAAQSAHCVTGNLLFYCNEGGEIVALEPFYCSAETSFCESFLVFLLGVADQHIFQRVAFLADFEFTVAVAALEIPVHLHQQIIGLLIRPCQAFRSGSECRRD